MLLCRSGAGCWLFHGRRWLDPRSSEDLALVITNLLSLARKAKPFASCCDLGRVLPILAAVSSAWTQLTSTEITFIDGAHTFRSSPIHSLEANGLQFRSKTPCPPFIDTAAQAPSDLFPLDDDRSHPAGLIVAPTSAPSPRWDTAVSTRPEGPQTSAGIDIRALLSDAEPATPLPWLVRPARAAQPDSAAVSLVPHPRRDPPGSNTEPAGQPLQSVSAGGGGADMPGASSRAAERGHGPAPGASVPDVSQPPRLFPAAESRLPPLRLALLGLGPTSGGRPLPSQLSARGRRGPRATRTPAPASAERGPGPPAGARRDQPLRPTRLGSSSSPGPRAAAFLLLPTSSASPPAPSALAQVTARNRRPRATLTRPCLRHRAVLRGHGGGARAAAYIFGACRPRPGPLPGLTPRVGSETGQLAGGQAWLEMDSVSESDSVTARAVRL